MTTQAPASCRNCRERPAGSNARALCVECWVNPAVRENVPLPLPPVRVKPSRAAPVRVSCRNCGSPVRRPRGLCWRCYYAPGVRERFATESIFGRRGLALDPRERPLPDSPTDAPPGSPEKIRVLQERARAGRALFHPADAIAFEPADVADLRPDASPRARAFRCCTG